MSARGVHFAVTAAQAKSLLAAESDRELMTLIEDIEEADEPEEEDFAVDSDKAWDGIHRCLTDGHLGYENGEYPLNHCVCGGQQLIRGDDYTVSFVSANKVIDVTEAIKKLTEGWMRQRYSTIDPAEYEFELGDEDFDYLWAYFLHLRRFYEKAAEAGRAVIFTVDA